MDKLPPKLKPTEIKNESLDKLPPKLNHTKPKKTKNVSIFHSIALYTLIFVLMIIMPIATLTYMCIGFYSEYNSVYCSTCNLYYGVPDGEQFNYNNYNGEKCFECNKPMSNILFKSESDKYSELYACRKCKVIERDEEKILTTLSGSGEDVKVHRIHKICDTSIYVHSFAGNIKSVIMLIAFAFFSIFSLILLIGLMVKTIKYMYKNIRFIN